MNTHKHKFTIPVEWQEKPTFYPTDDKGNGYYGIPRTVVTKLQCECGKVKQL